MVYKCLFSNKIKGSLNYNYSVQKFGELISKNKFPNLVQNWQYIALFHVLSQELRTLLSSPQMRPGGWQLALQAQLTPLSA
jgi:hypothetical protein